jgi:hypothetical protein
VVPVNPDFKELLAEFNAQAVEYLVVGAHALAAHGHVRATKDLDVWVRPSPENASRVLRALAEFGAPLHDLSEQDLTQAGIVFSLPQEVPPLAQRTRTAQESESNATQGEAHVSQSWPIRPVRRNAHLS